MGVNNIFLSAKDGSRGGGGRPLGEETAMPARTEGVGEELRGELRWEGVGSWRSAGCPG